MTGVLIKGKVWKQSHTQRENHVKTPRECHLQAKECLRLPDTGREDWNRFSFTALRRNQPCRHLEFGHPALRAVRQPISGVQVTQFVALLQQP